MFIRISNAPIQCICCAQLTEPGPRTGSRNFFHIVPRWMVGNSLLWRVKKQAVTFATVLTDRWTWHQLVQKKHDLLSVKFKDIQLVSVLWEWAKDHQYKRVKRNYNTKWWMNENWNFKVDLFTHLTQEHVILTFGGKSGFVQGIRAQEQLYINQYWKMLKSPDQPKQPVSVTNHHHLNMLGEKRTSIKSKSCYTFTVGIIVSQWAEAVLANAAVPCLQVHTVGVLHAAVALRAEVMTCRRHTDEGWDPEVST